MWAPLWLTILQSSLSGAISKTVIARVKEVVLDDANEFNCRAQHCATVLGCATDNEQQNAGHKLRNLRIDCIVSNVHINSCLAFQSAFEVFRA